MHFVLLFVLSSPVVHPYSGPALAREDAVKLRSLVEKATQERTTKVSLHSDPEAGHQSAQSLKAVRPLHIF